MHSPIMHISDLHFGRVDSEVCDGLTAEIEALKPKLLAISGDVTQRATTQQFEAFQKYIQSFDIPKIIVPGNHDIPLFNPFRRFIRPLKRFRKIVEGDEFPSYEDDSIFVLGANTAHSWTVSGGRLTSKTTDTISDRFDRIDPKKLRILVCHHPMHAAEKINFDWVGGIEKIRARVDMVLTGHLHLTATEILPRTLPGEGERSAAITQSSGINATSPPLAVAPRGSSVILLRAGTAISKRQRGEPNTYNLIHAHPEHVEIEHRMWNSSEKRFQSNGRQAFAVRDGLYREITPPASAAP